MRMTYTNTNYESPLSEVITVTQERSFLSGGDEKGNLKRGSSESVDNEDLFY